MYAEGCLKPVREVWAGLPEVGPAVPWSAGLADHDRRDSTAGGGGFVLRLGKGAVSGGLHGPRRRYDEALMGLCAFSSDPAEPRSALGLHLVVEVPPWLSTGDHRTDYVSYGR